MTEMFTIGHYITKDSHANLWKQHVSANKAESQTKTNEEPAVSLIHTKIRQCNSLKAALSLLVLLNEVGSGKVFWAKRVRTTEAESWFSQSVMYLKQWSAGIYNKQIINIYSFNTPVSLYRYFPFGIVFLVAGKILDMHDPVVLAEKLGMYFMTVLAGLFVHGVILLPMFFFLFTRKNPFSYIRGLLQALVIALATSSR